MVNDQSSVEQVEAYLDALGEERKGYEARLKAAKAGRPERLSADELQHRIGDVDAEVKRAKALLGEDAKPKKAKGEKPEEPSEA